MRVTIVLIDECGSQGPTPTRSLRGPDQGDESPLYVKRGHGVSGRNTLVEPTVETEAESVLDPFHETRLRKGILFRPDGPSRFGTLSVH